MTYPVAGTYRAKWVQRSRGATVLDVPLKVVCEKGHRKEIPRPSWLQPKTKVGRRNRGF